jgi:hypothetical protein
MNTPILLMVYIKPETTIKIIERLQDIEPKKIYISINIPTKENEKEIIKNKKVVNILKKINWKCKIKYKKRKKHVDAFTSYKEAIEWFFKNEKEGIILEDDTLPNVSFFKFCSKMLKKYRHNKKISQICGSSFKNFKKTDDFYFFSNYNLCWGYATWRRSILDFDEKMLSWNKLKKENYLYEIVNDKKFVFYWTSIFEQQFKKKFRAWDYLWLYSNWKKKKVSIIPKKHLVKNIGFVKDATHTKIKYKDWYNDLNTEELEITNLHPKTQTADNDYDKWISKTVFRVNKIYFKNKILNNKIYKKLNSIKKIF